MIVVDASVAAKWIFEEEHKDKATKLRDRHLLGKEKILVPQLIFYEIANSIITKAYATKNDVKKGLNLLFSLKLDVQKEQEKDLLTTSLLALKYKTTVYDMIYAVIAKENKTILITSDKKFIEKTGFKFVKHIKDI